LTIIEILSNDEVNEDYFLIPNMDYYDNNYNNLKNEKIYIVQFPGGKKLGNSEGEIIKIGGNLQEEKNMNLHIKLVLNLAHQEVQYF